MGEKIRQHIRSNVIGYVALFVALSGTAYAANTVGSADIIDESILSQDIKNAEVKQPDLAPNSVGTGKIIDGAVGSADVADDTTGSALTGTDIADNALTGTDIADKSILTDDIGFATITGANISDGSITGADVGFGSLTGSDVADSSLTGSDIAPGSLTGSDIADTSSIGGAEIDESDLEIPFTAVDDVPDTGECEGVLSNSPEVCADVDAFTLVPPFSRLFIVASGGWSKQLGDPAQSVCRIQVNDQDPPEALLFMGDQTGFGGGHSIPRAQLPFTLNATTDSLGAGTYDIELKCDDESSGDQNTIIGNAHISAFAAG